MASKVVLANGCFDPFHYGHLLHLQAAREFGDFLVVALTEDNSVNKGPGRPVFNHNQRAAVLRELRCVDRVIIVGSSIGALHLVNPHVFVKGNDYKCRIKDEDYIFCNENSIEIKFTNTEKFSSTQLLRHYESGSR